MSSLSNQAAPRVLADRGAARWVLGTGLGPALSNLRGMRGPETHVYCSTQMIDRQRHGRRIWLEVNRWQYWGTRC